MSELDNCWKKDSRESWDDVGHRVTAFLAWLAATVAVPGCLYDAIVVVSHGVWIEALLHLYSPAAASAAAATPTNDPQPQRQQQQRHRVYNTDAYGCECVVSTADQRFLRLQDVRLICSHEQVSNLCKEAAFAA